MKLVTQDFLCSEGVEKKDLGAVDVIQWKRRMLHRDEFLFVQQKIKVSLTVLIQCIGYM